MPTRHPALADQHAAIWAAIDAIAAQRVLSTSGLAKLAGLDPTSFNKSKRTHTHGAQGPFLRWPTTESVARVLRATGRDWTDFGKLVEQHLPQPRAQEAA